MIRSAIGRRQAMVLGAAMVAGAARAQQAAQETRIIVPFTAGGTTDVLARLYADHLRQATGGTVVVDNRPGAGGAIGVQAVKAASPDGRTLLVNNTAFIQGAILNKSAGYDPIKDFEPITHLAMSPVALAIPAALGVRTLADFVQLVKKSGKPFSYGNAGVGQTTHFYGELLNKTAGLNMVYVPYKGEIPFITDLVAGHVSMGFATVASLRPHIDSGRLVALAVPGNARSAMLPGVPTLKEAGFQGFEAVGWFGLFAPAGTPVATLTRLSEVANRMLADKAVSRKLEEFGLPPVGGTVQEFRDTVARDLASWTNMVHTTQIKVP